MSRGGEAILVSCLDANGDLRINGVDGPDLTGLDIPLKPGEGCMRPDRYRDFYTGTPAGGAYGCGGRAPLLIVNVGGGGTELLAPAEGESLGMLAIVNGIQERAAAAGIATLPVLTTSAIVGADLPQTRMEEWIAHYVARRLDALPCLRAVIIGHSHGGVTVSSVTAALDASYASRLYGVLLDRSVALYDRFATEFPAAAPLLNVYQTDEGWHGEYLPMPNVTNLDETGQLGPIAPSDANYRGISFEEAARALVPITHKTIDDSPPVQQHVIDAVIRWAGG